MDTSEPSPPPPREHTYDILGTYMRKKYIDMAKNSTTDEVREAMQRRNYSQHDIDSVLRTASNRRFFRRFLCYGDPKIEK
jgi:SpoVK/Ycf46/Vps4 family AAA+-type ATPase